MCLKQVKLLQQDISVTDDLAVPATDQEQAKKMMTTVTKQQPVPTVTVVTEQQPVSSVATRTKNKLIIKLTYITGCIQSRPHCSKAQH